MTSAAPSLLGICNVNLWSDSLISISADGQLFYASYEFGCLKNNFSAVKNGRCCLCIVDVFVLTFRNIYTYSKPKLSYI